MASNIVFKTGSQNCFLYEKVQSGEELESGPWYAAEFLEAAVVSAPLFVSYCISNSESLGLLIEYD